ncbi:hypothetical protein NCCP1664_20670 [Zafaria cholistanensis]|uniref:Uncharacterized protein n=1 Tax=Zafaria cholistanensis TaxID=1682741 RepID=A0A5A7NTV2_9MICC|nr:hypothetical protein NCCP1664_20670 [Zafaria cholistanensis]
MGSAVIASASPAASAVQGPQPIVVASHKSKAQSKPAVVIRDLADRTVEAGELATVKPKVKLGKRTKLVSKTLTVMQGDRVVVEGAHKARLGAGTYQVTIEVKYQTLVKQVVVKTKGKGNKVKKTKRNVWSAVLTESDRQTLVVVLEPAEEDGADLEPIGEEGDSPESTDEDSGNEDSGNPESTDGDSDS